MSDIILSYAIGENAVIAEEACNRMFFRALANLSDLDKGHTAARADMLAAALAEVRAAGLANAKPMPKPMPGTKAATAAKKNGRPTKAPLERALDRALGVAQWVAKDYSARVASIRGMSNDPSDCAALAALLRDKAPAAWSSLANAEVTRATVQRKARMDRAKADAAEGGAEDGAEDGAEGAPDPAVILAAILASPDSVPVDVARAIAEAAVALLDRASKAAAVAEGAALANAA